MKTTEARIFCGRDEDGPIILVAGTKDHHGSERIQYFQNPGPKLQGAARSWEGMIRTDAAARLQEVSEEECKDLIGRFFPGVQVKYVSLEEVLS